MPRNHFHKYESLDILPLGWAELIDSWSQFAQDAAVFLKLDVAFAVGKKNKGNASTCLCFGLIWKG